MTEENMAELIRVSIQKGNTGMFLATSSTFRGLLGMQKTVEELCEEIPRLIEHLYAANGKSMMAIQVAGESFTWAAVPVDMVTAQA